MQPEGEEGKTGWYKRVKLVACVVGLAVLGVPLITVFPYYADDWKLDRIVKMVALDWRDFGYEKAQVRLDYELDKAEISMYVSDNTCKMTVIDGQKRLVKCDWAVVLTLPFTHREVPLVFASEAVVDIQGNLE
jgi:hypothetical protein